MSGKALIEGPPKLYILPVPFLCDKADSSTPQKSSSLVWLCQLMMITFAEIM